MPLENLSLVFRNKLLDKVFSVAKTPILLLFVSSIAGLIAGSIPTIGILNFFLRTSIAFVVAVLQATMISLQCKSTNF